jgi:hypothetical protein
VASGQWPVSSSIPSGNEIVLIAGLPGCGKTTYLCEMLRDHWLIFDDFKREAFNDSSKFRDSRKFSALIQALRDQLRCVVADINFCRLDSRQEAEREVCAEVPGVRLSWRFFENDPSACEANVTARNRVCLQRELNLIGEYSPLYCIPRDAVVLPVWRKKN